MSQELLYTSAPHGLKLGSRGFCTVLSTQGMPAPLASGLEALSGYRPAYPSSDSRAHLNPVVQSHVTLPVAGRSWHVLSRIADYGLDYSQRTNKLAHHVVLDPGELIPGGPAYLLSLPAFMRTEWNEEPHLVAPKPVKKAPPTATGVCRAWKELTGDAGWAGVLAESFLRDPERPVFLLYEPGQDVLPLMAEAISLLPVERRWEVTFSTYFNGLPQGVTCAWRCMLNDSPEAHQSLRFVKALRLDLTSESLGIATGGSLVDLARVGGPFSVTAAQSVKRAASQPGSDQKQHVSEHGDQKPTDDADSDEVIVDDKIPLARAEPPSLVGASKSVHLAHSRDRTEGAKPRRSLADLRREDARIANWKWQVLGIAACSVLSLGGIGFIVMKFGAAAKTFQQKKQEDEASSIPAKLSGAVADSPNLAVNAESEKRNTPPQDLNKSSGEAPKDVVASAANKINISNPMPPVAPVAAGTGAIHAAPSNELTVDKSSEKEEPVAQNKLRFADEIQIGELAKQAGRSLIDPQLVPSVFKEDMQVENPKFTLLQPFGGHLVVDPKNSLKNVIAIGDAKKTPDEKTYISRCVTLSIKNVMNSSRMYVTPDVANITKSTELGWYVVDLTYSDKGFKAPVRLGFIQEELPLHVPCKLLDDDSVTFQMPFSMASRTNFPVKIDEVKIAIDDQHFTFSAGADSVELEKFLGLIAADDVEFANIKPQWIVDKIAPWTVDSSDMPQVAPVIKLHLKSWSDGKRQLLKKLTADCSKWAAIEELSATRKSDEANFKQFYLVLDNLKSFKKMSELQIDEMLKEPSGLATAPAQVTASHKDDLRKLLVRVRDFHRLSSCQVVAARIYYDLHEAGNEKPISRRNIIDFGYGK
ncbi:MAG: hypothetical protein V4719_12615 [Planctomycetota bacterium]